MPAVLDRPDDHSDNQKEKWFVPVSEDGFVNLPEELVSKTGWSVGTPLFYYRKKDGSMIISDEHEEPEDAFSDFSEE